MTIPQVKQLAVVTSAARTATGNSLSFNTSNLSALSIDINVTVVSGTNPTMDFYYQRQGFDGVWYNALHVGQLTAAGILTTDLGPALTSDVALGNAGRLGWVVGGTATPTFTFSASVMSAIPIHPAAQTGATVTELQVLASGSITASGNNGLFNTNDINALSVDISVGSPTGTNPTLDFYLDRQGFDGVWYQQYHFTQFTAAGTISKDFGPGLANTIAPGNAMRLRWVIGGSATPTFPTVSASIMTALPNGTVLYP